MFARIIAFVFVFPFFEGVAQNKWKQGMTIPGFNSITLEGAQFSLDSVHSKYILIDFWASWCSPCLENNEELVAIYNQYRSKGFEIIAIGLEERVDLLKKTCSKFNYPWNMQLWEFEGFDSPLATDFQVDALPKSYLIDSTRQILLVNPDMYDLEKKLKKLFK